jgi:hypothetical protein
VAVDPSQNRDNWLQTGKAMNPGMAVEGQFDIKRFKQLREIGL